MLQQIGVAPALLTRCGAGVIHPVLRYTPASDRSCDVVPGLFIPSSDIPRRVIAHAMWCRGYSSRPPIYPGELISHAMWRRGYSSRRPIYPGPLTGLEFAGPTVWRIVQPVCPPSTIVGRSAV